jgi:hypothetical protein
MMIFGAMKWYVYLLISAGVFAFFLIFGLIAGEGVISIISDMRNAAVGAGGLPAGIADLIVQPIVFALQGDIINAAIVGLLWPLTMVWLLLIVILLFFAYIIPGAGTARGTLSG